MTLSIYRNTAKGASKFDTCKIAGTRLIWLGPVCLLIK